MIDLITLAQAKVQVRVTNTDNDIDLGMKVTQASAIILDYLKASTPPDEWVVNSSPITYDIPANVQTATLLVLGELFMNRESSTANLLSETVRNLLDRTPSMA